jgi:hypothetical protein
MVLYIRGSVPRTAAYALSQDSSCPQGGTKPEETHRVGLRNKTIFASQQLRVFISPLYLTIH